MSASEARQILEAAGWKRRVVSTLATGAGGCLSDFWKDPETGEWHETDFAVETVRDRIYNP